MAAGFKFQSNAGNGAAVGWAAGTSTEALDYPTPQDSLSNGRPARRAAPNTPEGRLMSGAMIRFAYQEPES